MRVLFAAICTFLFIPFSVCGQELSSDTLKSDTLEKEENNFQSRYIHAVSVRFNGGAVISSHPFLKGDNAAAKPVNRIFASHLKYSFHTRTGTWTDKVFGSPYQGVGISYNNFFNTHEIGNPLAAYIFQGARIARISSRLALNYEWNLGVSWRWKPYDIDNNPYNHVVGSKVNAYLNLAFLFRYALNEKLDFEAGVSGTHFSNGNTKTPNNGVNALSADAGLIFNFGRTSAEYRESKNIRVLKYPRHMEHEILFFGSWRQTAVNTEGTKIESPYLNQKFAVVGISYSALYAPGYKVRVGGGIDAHYDQGAGVLYEEIGGQVSLIDTDLNKKIFLGASARADYIMPYFTVSMSLGYNFIHSQTNYKPFYQTLSLKVNVTKNTFVNVGYRLSSFQNPNFLMLGFGFRLNNHR